MEGATRVPKTTFSQTPMRTSLSNLCPGRCPLQVALLLTICFGQSSCCISPLVEYLTIFPASLPTVHCCMTHHFPTLCVQTDTICSSSTQWFVCACLRVRLHLHLHLHFFHICTPKVRLYFMHFIFWYLRNAEHFVVFLVSVCMFVFLLVYIFCCPPVALGHFPIKC